MSKIVTLLIFTLTWSPTQLPFVRYNAIVEAISGAGRANKQDDGPDRLAIVTKTNFVGQPRTRPSEAIFQFTAWLCEKQIPIIRIS